MGNPFSFEKAFLRRFVEARACHTLAHRGCMVRSFDQVSSVSIVRGMVISFFCFLSKTSLRDRHFLSILTRFSKLEAARRNVNSPYYCPQNPYHGTNSPIKTKNFNGNSLGVVAQLGEHYAGSVKVVGSIPIHSTNLHNRQIFELQTARWQRGLIFLEIE